jgi:NitT/TauT family transport system permease protein
MNAPERAEAFAADAAAAERFRASRRRRSWRRRLLPLAAAALIGLIWWVAVEAFAIPVYVVPSPLHVAETFQRDFGTLMRNLLPTAAESLLGFCLGNLAAILVASVFVHQRHVREGFFPMAVLFNTIPIIAIAPILVLLLGNDMKPKIAIAALISFFPTLVNMVRGLESVPPQALELMRVLSASRREVFFKLRLQNSLPYLFSALKITASTSVIGAIVGEWIGSTYGIGALIIQATYNFDTGLLYASVLMGSTYSVGFFALVSFIEGRVVRWAPETH